MNFVLVFVVATIVSTDASCEKDFCKSTNNDPASDGQLVFGYCFSGEFQRCNSVLFKEFSTCCQDTGCFNNRSAFMYCCGEPKQEVKRSEAKEEICTNKLQEKIETMCNNFGGTCVKDKQSFQDCCRKPCSYKKLKQFCCKPA